MSAPILEVQSLCKTVFDATGPLHILKNIDFSLAMGSSLAIVGRSGSGKSTLLGIMAGLDVPSSGVVRLNGQDFSALGEDERARVRATAMGFVFQSFQLLGHLSALDNVQLPLDLLGHSNAREKAKLMLERVGLGQRLDHLPKFLSGGEQQRVAIARAFVTQAKLLLADEPTGSLDWASGDLVVSLMLELQAENGTTLVMVTHDEELAGKMAHCIRLEAGEAIAQR